MPMKRWLSIGKIIPSDQQINADVTRGLSKSGAVAKPTPRVSERTKSQLFLAAFNWSLCLLLLLLVLSQLLTILLSTSSKTQYFSFGQSPSLGTYAISGQNDEPYSDRVLVCHRRSKRFEVISVNEALMTTDTIVEDISGLAVNGYRVVNRTGATVADATKRFYSRTCSTINATLEYMFSVCNELGYMNLTRDTLRVVDDINSVRLHLIPNSLPVLIMPFWDNGPSARYAIPGWDGRACMFRLRGKYEEADAPDAYLDAVNRTVREAKTVEWLGRPGGEWRNGWYEDAQGMRWFSDVVNTNPLNSDGLAARRFDTIGKRELDCRNGAQCPPQFFLTQWGSNLEIRNTFIWSNSIMISNGKRFGLFLYEASGYEVVTCVYDVGSFVSDSTFVYLVMRWILSMIAVQRGFVKGVTAWHNVDIGCLASSYSFEALPISMLPRLKILIAAFCSVGCVFEGDQRALSESWFVIYPAIVAIVFLESSLLNSLAKIFRRRMTSWQIPVAIALLSTMHYIREQIATSKMFGFDGRVSVLIQSQELEKMSLLDMLQPSVALRLSGNTKSLLWIKLSILLLNAAPLFFSQDMSTKSKRHRFHASCETENSLRIRACNVGGVGLSDVYDWVNQNGEPRQILNSYELVRLGYVVVGNVFLVSWENWMFLAMIMPFRSVFRWRNHRVMVFDVIKATGEDRIHRISMDPHMINMADPRLLNIKWWDIDARSFI